MTQDIHDAHDNKTCIRPTSLVKAGRYWAKLFAKRHPKQANQIAKRSRHYRIREAELDHMRRENDPEYDLAYHVEILGKLIISMRASNQSISQKQGKAGFMADNMRRPKHEPFHLAYVA